MPGDGRVTVEDVFGDFGFRARWRAHGSFAEVEAFRLLSRLGDGEAEFERRGSAGPLEDPTTEIGEAEPNLTGSVKSDGCSHIEIRETHYCGPDDYQAHVDLLRYVYARAFDLMGRDPERRWGEADAARDARPGGVVIEGRLAPPEIGEGGA